MNNVIPLPKKKEKESSEERLIIVEKENGWVEYSISTVFFLDGKAFGYDLGYKFLNLEPERAMMVDDPEVIREQVKINLERMKISIEQALISVDKPIVRFKEENNE